MLLDMLSSDEYINFNKKLAHILGLEDAIYVQQLLTINKKAMRKDKLVNGDFIKIDRNYIYEQTTLTIEKQIKIDINLQKHGVIEKDFDDNDLIKLDTNKLANIITSDNDTMYEELQNITTKQIRVDKNTKQNAMQSKLYNYVNTGNDSLNDSLYGWINSCVKGKGVYLNKQLVEKFQKDLYAYCKGNLEIGLEIVNIATMYSYRDCSWAIRVYERDVKEKQPKDTATKETLLNKVF